MDAVVRRSVPPEPIQTWVHRSGEAADWLQEKFDEGDMEITTSFKKGNPNAHNFDVPQTEITFHSPQWTKQTTGNAGGMGIYIVKDLCNTLSKRSNVDLRYNTPAVQLVRADDGRVTGAICKDEDGYFKVNARNGVILATVSGLVVDGERRVLDYDNEVIPGLYAAGCASGRYYSDNDKCLSCHEGSYDALAELTSDLDPYNPHKQPHGQMNCNECHKGHAAQVDVCAQCHDNGGQEMKA